MTSQTKKFRLDQILIDLGLVSDDQIKVALDLQKHYGGRFGSLLIHKGFIDEAGLVQALARQLGCNGVVLSKLTIDEPVYRMIPQRVALARKVIPFDYDLDNNVLKIACADPSDESLLNELGFNRFESIEFPLNFLWLNQLPGFNPKKTKSLDELNGSGRSFGRVGRHAGFFKKRIDPTGRICWYTSKTGVLFQ